MTTFSLLGGSQTSPIENRERKIIEVDDPELNVCLYVMDAGTKQDALPYVAYSPVDPSSSPGENAALCLRALEPEESATIEFDLLGEDRSPELDESMDRAEIHWRVVDTDDDGIIGEGDFAAGLASLDLSLKQGGEVSPERIFEVQIGPAGAEPFEVVQSAQVHLLRDRLSWWFEPCSIDFGWRPSQPEMRKDTGEYRHPQRTAYTREALQSIYAFLAMEGKGIFPKGSWLKPSVTCFGEFNEKLKEAHGADLIDLNTVERLDLTSVVSLNSQNERINALGYTLTKQSAYHNLDPNPAFKVRAKRERVNWVMEAVENIGDTRLPLAVLLAKWQTEGSLKVNGSDSIVEQYSSEWLRDPESGFDPKGGWSSSTGAKLYYAYATAWSGLGADFLTTHIKGENDNRLILNDFDNSYQHFISQADRFGGRGFGASILGDLDVTLAEKSWGSYYMVTGNAAFFTKMLEMAGRFFLSEWKEYGADITYMAYNVGGSTYGKVLNAYNSGKYLERTRLSFVDWVMHYEIRDNEWKKPRRNALRFHFYRKVFEGENI